MSKYTLTVHYEYQEKTLLTVLELDTDSLESVQALLWSNKDNWLCEGFYVNVYENNNNLYASQPNVIYHYPEV